MREDPTRKALRVLLRYAEQHGAARYSADLTRVMVHAPGCPGICPALPSSGPQCGAVELVLDGKGAPIAVRRWRVP